MPSFKVILGILFVLLTASISILGVSALRSLGETSNTANRAEQSRRVLEQADEIASAYKAAQQESNAAFMRPDTVPINRYRETTADLRTAMDSLLSLTRDNPAQHQRAGELESLLTDLIAFTDAAFYDPSVRTLSAFDKRIAENSVHRYRIQRAIDVIKAEERNLLILRQTSNQVSIERSRNLMIVLLIFALLIIGATFLSMRHNFNKRVRVEQQLLTANELFYKLFYESPVGLILTSPDNGVIVDCNEAYSRLINYGREDVIGKTARSLGVVDEDIQGANYVEQAYSQGIVRNVEMVIHPKDSNPVWVSIAIQPIRIKDRECLLSAVQDVSAHKEAEATIQAALDKEIELNRLKSNFVSMASHEFRTPLTTVLSSAFLLENYLPGDTKEKTSKHISRIKSSVNALTNILDEFLSLTKIEEGKTVPASEEVDVRALISAICTSQQAFAKPSQHIEYSHQGTQTLNSDAGILTGIASNLISNAIKYSPDGGKITVSSKFENGRFELTVTDTGIGIPIADQPHLFDRFYRASNAGNIQGTGLGLHITKHYVDLLKGSINFKSRPGQGSSFTVTLSQPEGGNRD